jgi:SAM-dependent methyltransferase
MNMDSAVRRSFLDDYRTVRYAEGRGSDDPEYYRSLPYMETCGNHRAQWSIRAQTWKHFEKHVLAEFERRWNRPLDVLDLGAGNGWTSWRLSLRRHKPVALDIFNDPKDGLGATRRYAESLAAVEAEFNELPFRAGAFDIALFNASFHYSSDYTRTLAETRRCLRREGAVVIMDSPIYKLPEHGMKMRTERRAQFEKQYGFPSDALQSIEFLDEPAIARLGRDLNVRWSYSQANYGWRWTMRPVKAWILRKRPPSRFTILVGRFES